MTRVLLLCTGNSCRSQMAEAFLRAFGGGQYEVFSAGLAPGVINPYTYRVMAELGFDLAGHRSKGLDEYQGKMEFDYVITVCDDADRNCPLYLSRTAQRLHWPFEDPAAFTGSDEETLAKFRQVRDAIADRVRQWTENPGVS